VIRRLARFIQRYEPRMGRFDAATGRKGRR
jgi:hypothetical protein